MKALGLIMKTVNTNIALEIQSMADVSNTAALEKCRPNTKEIWEHLKSHYQKVDPVTSQRSG